MASEDAEDQDDAAFDNLLRGALGSIRGEFQERTWQAFWRTVVEGESAAQAGAKLQMQPGAVRMAVSRVLWRLRKELGQR